MDSLLLGKLATFLPANAAGVAPEILTPASLTYDAVRQVNNTKFQFKPAAIILVETKEQVSELMKFVNRFPTEFTLRVRSGGHDHEGESSGTDALLIDFSKMNKVEVRWQNPLDADRYKEEQERPAAEPKPFAYIQPGARFQDIKPILDQAGVGIPHGTCQTVGIAGYTMGGGWGPWTRLYGMGCERLVGATIVLGNGEIKQLSIDDAAGTAEAQLLWALRGGGGMSYGIVTELCFAAFELPQQLCSFNLHCDIAWPNRTALDILNCWEEAIYDIENTKLIGTNLKIVAKNLAEGAKPNPRARLKCTFNGYFEGSEAEALTMIEKYFNEPAMQGVVLQTHYGVDLDESTNEGNIWHFDSWDRQVPKQMALSNKLAALDCDANKQDEIDIRNEISLESDGPAPHKITSRLVNGPKNGEQWNEKSRKALICSLQSPLVPSKQDLLGNLPGENYYVLNCYITLGAIVGPFYAALDEKGKQQSAFPYKERPFTIQFQAWWNQYLNAEGLPIIRENKAAQEGDNKTAQCKTLDSKNDPTNNLSAIIDDVLANRKWANRAEDWIAACRDYEIPGTSGAFISFKDSSVRTSTYFSESYAKLVNVKQEHSKDKYTLLRSRKTII